jgi:hypothetical protein
MKHRQGNFIWLVIYIFMVVYPEDLYAQDSIQLTIQTFNKLNQKPVKGCHIFLDNKLQLFENDSSNTYTIKIEGRKGIPYTISINCYKFFDPYILRIDGYNYFRKDTIIKVFLEMPLHPRSLPVFFFDQCDTNSNLKNDSMLEVFKYIIANNPSFEFIIKGFCDFQEMNNCPEIAIKRANNIRDRIIQAGTDTCIVIVERNSGYKPYQILFNDDMLGPFLFEDILDQHYIEELSMIYREKAMRFNRRVEVTVRIKKP